MAYVLGRADEAMTKRGSAARWWRLAEEGWTPAVTICIQFGVFGLLALPSGPRRLRAGRAAGETSHYFSLAPHH